MHKTAEIRTEQHGYLAVVTIDRPASLNAFTQQMYQEFGNIFRDLANDESTRCVLLKAEGDRAFCVGSDIGEFHRSLGQPERQIEETRVGRLALDALNACPQPIVVAINGVCAGGGLQIAAGCDIRVCADNSRFGIPIKNLGMHAEIEDLMSMMRVLGQNLCLDLLLTGRMLEAGEALACGFIHRLTEAPQVNNTALSLAEEIAQGAPLAARWHKRAIRALADNTDNAAHLAEQALGCYRLDDFAEGCAAFVEKRKAVFSGS